jgi:hypothetical protein
MGRMSHMSHRRDPMSDGIEGVFSDIWDASPCVLVTRTAALNGSIARELHTDVSQPRHHEVNILRPGYIRMAGRAIRETKKWS